jgi:thymidylate synthase
MRKQKNTTFKIIVAKSNNVIGCGDKLPWSIKSDLKMFRETTMGSGNNCVIVGSKTYLSMPKLHGRTTFVITSKPDSVIGVGPNRGWVQTFPNLSSALDACGGFDEVFIAGGAQLYKEALLDPRCSEIIVTEVRGPIIGTPTTWMPPIPVHFKLDPSSTSWIDGLYALERHTFRSPYDHQSDENAYLIALQNILHFGGFKGDRTGVGTKSLFGTVLDFDLTGSTFPLITTKKMFLRGVIKELLFFLKGQVDNDILVADGVHIWDGNTTREFLDKRGLSDMEPGSLGKAYGFQWRHWGAEWAGKNADYTGHGHDQLADVITKLKTDPMSRRIVLNAWNVSDLSQMCLEPCHTMYIFNVQIVSGAPRLYCHLTQRSGDMFLGVPFNIASAALLTLILTKTCGLEPGGLKITIVDAHIYKNHFDQCALQLRRRPFAFPKLTITKSLADLHDIESLKYEDFAISGYQSHPAIKADMAV